MRKQIRKAYYEFDDNTKFIYKLAPCKQTAKSKPIAK